jgi:hypothetical protein
MEVEFEPLDRETIIDRIPRYHPLWAATDPDLIGDIYDRIEEWSQTGGVLGEWARLTRLAIPICAPRDIRTIDVKVAQTLFTLRNMPWAGADENARGEESDTDTTEDGE